MKQLNLDMTLSEHLTETNRLVVQAEQTLSTVNIDPKILDAFANLREATMHTKCAVALIAHCLALGGVCLADVLSFGKERR